MDTADHLPAGTVVDRYTIERPLGQGGMAVVYQVRHNQLGTLHAMKMLMMPVRSVRRRLLQEGRVQAALRHPNIVAVTDVIDFEDAPGLVMEFVAGPSLDQLLDRHALTFEQADIIASGIIQGVAAAHAQGLIHRDLKPANVLLEVTKGGLVPKVADFGLAKVLEGPSGHTQTRSGVTMGTPAYMAPEQVRDAKNVDARADVFSLGCILYDLATGERAFRGADTFELFSAVTSGRYTPPREVKADIPERFENAIVGALQTDPDKRIPDCETLLEVWLGRRAFDAEAAGAVEAEKVWGDVLNSATSFSTESESAPPTSSNSAANPDTYYVGGGTAAGGVAGIPASGIATVAGVAAPFEEGAFERYLNPAPSGSLVPRDPTHPPPEDDFHERPTTVAQPTSSGLLSQASNPALLIGAPLVAILLLVGVLGFVGVGLVVGSGMLTSAPHTAPISVPTASPAIGQGGPGMTVEPVPPEPPTATEEAPVASKAAPSPEVRPTVESAPAPRPAEVVASSMPPREAGGGTQTTPADEVRQPPPNIVVRQKDPVATPPEKSTPVEAAPEPPKPWIPPPGKGRIIKEGDGTLYVSVDRQFVLAGDHPPGRYEMQVLFNPYKPIRTGFVEVSAGLVTVVRCPEMLGKCTQIGEPSTPTKP